MLAQHDYGLLVLKRYGKAGAGNAIAERSRHGKLVQLGREHVCEQRGSLKRGA